MSALPTLSTVQSLPGFAWSGPAERQPSDADKAAAERFVTERFDKDPTLCRKWLARHRADLVRQAAMLEMGKRQDIEFKAQFAPVRRAAA